MAHCELRHAILLVLFLSEEEALHKLILLGSEIAEDDLSGRVVNPAFMGRLGEKRGTSLILRQW